MITKDIAILLVNALVLTKIDYCNSLLVNINKDKINSLQVAQNDAARLIFRRSRFNSASNLLRELHWLPVFKRIDYKICSLVHKSIHSFGPEYILNLLKFYTPTRNLRSNSDCLILSKQPTSRKIGEQSFSFSAPQIWNSLPRDVRWTDNVNQFKKGLKTFLFNYYCHFFLNI